MKTTTTTTVTDWSQALDAIDGRTYTLDGVHGTIKVDRRDPLRTHVSHEPSAKGKRSAPYLATKARLRDDWSTDLSWSERLADIASALGVVMA